MSSGRNRPRTPTPRELALAAIGRRMDADLARAAAGDPAVRTALAIIARELAGARVAAAKLAQRRQARA